jgi:WD40 repeat protein
VDLSRDGRRLLVAGADRQLRILDERTLRPIGGLDGGAALVNMASFSPDAGRIVTAARDGATVWDVTTGARLLTLTGGEIATASYDRTGKRIVTAGADGTARIWDAETGAAALTIHVGTSLTKASFDATGARVLTSGGQEAAVWSAGHEGPPELVLRGHTSTVYAASFDEGARRIVTGGADGLAIVWDAANGQSLRTLVGHTSSVLSATFDPAGTRVVTTSQDGTVRLWDAERGSLLDSFAHRAGDAVFSTDGARIVSVGDDGYASAWLLDGATVTLEQLHVLLDCRTPFTLAQGIPVPTKQACEGVTVP